MQFQKLKKIYKRGDGSATVFPVHFKPYSSIAFEGELISWIDTRKKPRKKGGVSASLMHAVANPLQRQLHFHEVHDDDVSDFIQDKPLQSLTRTHHLDGSS